MTEIIKEVSCIELMAILPHRYPFILIDKLKDVMPGEYGTGVKNVTINEPFFQGHFPGYPVMPGVLQIEAMAQTAGTVVGLSVPVEERGNLKTLFMSVDKVKFRKPVVPGDVLEITVKKEQSKMNVYKFSGQVTCEGKLVSEAKFSAMIIK